MAIIDDLEKVFDSQIGSSDEVFLEDLKLWFDKKLESLVNKGKLRFKDDRYLGGLALEIRVRNSFSDIGFNVTQVNKIDCDGLLVPNNDFEIKNPIVFEIKSGKSLAPSRTELRQLDDYIFELSGEEKARKEGLGKEGIHYDPLANLFGHNLVKGKKYFHPTPQKGCMIFNNVEGTHFLEPSIFELGFNELEFVKKRNICVMTFRTLLYLTSKVKHNELSLTEFWNMIQKTEGVLNI